MIYLLGAASIVIQLMCILHVYRTGRAQWWMMVILFFSMLGCFAYFVFEIMPELFGPHSAGARKARAKALADPVDALNRAEAALAQVDTAANRLALGDAYAALGTHGEAALQYRVALDRMNGRDAKIEVKLAQTLFDGGDYAEALKWVERQETPVSVGEADRLTLLRARILAELGRVDEAAALYADIVERLPGAEARCRYGALLMDRGDREAARNQLQEAMKRASSDSDDPAMLGWAKTTLAELRG